MQNFTLVVISVMFFSAPVLAQRLDAIGKADPLKITGGISTNQIAYFASGVASRRAPYTAFVNANLNLDVYGYSVPLSFAISNQSKGKFQQPFNQFTLNPSYKWITAHLGYTSMSFSSYTLSNHSFAGAGVDLAPPKWPIKISAMYGRLQKAVVGDTLLYGNNIEPAYKRMGYGIKAGYAKNKNLIEVIFFKAKDEINSNAQISLNSTTTPQNNLVGGLNVHKVFFKKILLTGEFAASALTRNQRASRDLNFSSPLKPLDPLLKVNNSTALYFAYKTGLAYSGKKYTIGLGYERISPEYKTLGAYYFANDFENVTANIATKLLKDKLSLALSSGIQHDDLRKSKQSATNRFVGSLNMGYIASKKLNFNTTYSNFQSFVNIRSDFNQINQLTPYDNLDTLNYTQISQNLNINTNYILSQSKEKSKVLNANVSFMTSADKQGGISQNSGGNFYNINTSYSVNFIPKNLSLNTSLNISTNKVGPVQSTTVGPTFGANKSFFDKKLRSALSTSWNGSFANAKKTSGVVTLRLTNSYVVKKKHNLSLSMIGLNRSTASTQYVDRKSLNEFTTTLGYNYNF